ncbi:hypothetical protein K3F43_00025 [Pseudomonas tussilaginis]|uniref:hypothetical protein n=1 Tax=Pseudomonas sp. S11A 273 TaxID=2866277 RepID=UPI001C734B7E|nr:hypothetical protein [Pseudomonas sp. S11A 273]QYX47955.1 hypothetical protein K3F43_00025 [Pseudomonas sp. S11A 273]
MQHGRYTGWQSRLQPACLARPPDAFIGLFIGTSRMVGGNLLGLAYKDQEQCRARRSTGFVELVLPAMQTPRSTLHRVDPIAGKTGSHKSSAGAAAMAADCPLQKAEWRCLEEPATSPHRLDKLTLHTPDNPQTPFLLSVIRPRL